MDIGANRLEKAVTDRAVAADVSDAIKAGRTETWVVTTRPDGSTSVQVLDAAGTTKKDTTSCWIDAPKDRQATLLRVDHWYPELARKGRDELRLYFYGDPVKHPLEKGSYFGRWCIEAVAAVKAFGLDDSLCLGHEHYPGDLLRPDGPSTHVQQQSVGLLGKLTRRFRER
jgi:hypothetical protein